MSTSTRLLESPKQFAASAATAGTWHISSVTAAGPIENNGVFVFLNGDGLNGWYYANPAISALVNETALSCIQNKKQAYVEVDNTNILRLHLLAA